VRRSYASRRENPGASCRTLWFLADGRLADRGLPDGGAVRLDVVVVGVADRRLADRRQTDRRRMCLYFLFWLILLTWLVRHFSSFRNFCCRCTRRSFCPGSSLVRFKNTISPAILGACRLCDANCSTP